MTVSAALDVTPGPSARITIAGIGGNAVTDPYATNSGEWLSYNGYGGAGAGTFAVNQSSTGPDGSPTTIARKTWTTPPTLWHDQGIEVRANTSGAQWPVATSDGRTFSAWVYAASGSSKTFAIKIRWYNGATLLGETQSASVSGANTWLQLSIVLPQTLPYPTATSFLLALDVIGGASFWAAGEWMGATWAMIAPAGWVFPGTAAAASVQIFRGDGTGETRVSGDDQQIPAGAVYLTDYRVPPGKTISYRVVLYSAAGVVVFNGASGSLAVPAIDPSYAWVMDPEDPTRAMLLPLMAGTDAQVGHDSAGAAASPLSGLPIWLGGPRSRMTRPFVLKTSTAVETARFADMIQPGGQLLFRPGAALQHDTGLVYMGTASITKAPRHPYEGPAIWSFDGVEVADDEWPVVVEERTWLDVENEAATWLALEAMYATWLAVEQG